MKNHELKTDPAVFGPIWDGVNTNTIRFDDRGFKVGDKLTLIETQHTGDEMRNGAPLILTGRTTWREISHIQKGYGLGEGWCILSFKLPLPVAIAPLPEITGVDDRDRETLLYVARVLRGVADMGTGIPLGTLWYETMTAFGAVKGVLGLNDEDVEAMNDPQLVKMPEDAQAAVARFFRASVIESAKVRDAAEKWVRAGGGFNDSQEWTDFVEALMTAMRRFDLHHKLIGQELTVENIDRAIAAVE